MASNAQWMRQHVGAEDEALRIRRHHRAVNGQRQGSRWVDCIGRTQEFRHNEVLHQGVGDLRGAEENLQTRDCLGDGHRCRRARSEVTLVTGVQDGDGVGASWEIGSNRCAAKRSLGDPGGAQGHRGPARPNRRERGGSRCS